MKVGLIANAQHATDRDPVSIVDENRAMLRLARERGWDSFIVSMHYLPEGDVRLLQQVPLLANLAAEAGDMTLGLGIFLLNLHNPVYTAETLATLDVLSGGNLVCGIGLGYRDVEFDAFHVAKGQRVQRFEECLDVVKRLWSGEPVTHDGPTCTLRDVRATLRPVQHPHPPLWMAANHDNAVQRAARLGDCWYINPHATLQTNRRQMGLYLAERRRLGLPLPAEMPCRREMFCAPDRRTAMERAAPYLAERYRVYVQWGQDKVMPADDQLDQGFEELVRDRFIIGTPEDCYEQLRPYWEQLGVSHFVLRTQFMGMPVSHALQSMRLFSEEVLPALRRVTPTPLDALETA